MPTRLPWRFLISQLTRSDDGRVNYEEVERHGLDPSVLVREQLAEFGGAGTLRPHDCRHACEPLLDLETRRREGLVGIACPAEPSCWPGWDWVGAGRLRTLRVRADLTLAALARRNGLEPPTWSLPRPFFALGRLRRRGGAFPVVWVRRPGETFSLMCHGMRRQLGGDGLIVLNGSAEGGAGFDAADRIAVCVPSVSDEGLVDFLPALDRLDPLYRARALGDVDLDLDSVRLRFGTIPGERHVLHINGVLHPGFQKTDLRFLRLLLLAIARKHGPDDGWIDKAALRGGSDKDREIEELREEISGGGVAGEAMEALLRVRRRTRLIRLGPPPENIEFDESLAALALIAARQTRQTEAQRAGVRNAELLLKEVKKRLDGG